MLSVVLLLYTDQCFYYIVQLDPGRLNKTTVVQDCISFSHVYLIRW